MAKVRLARNQTISADGIVLLGTRDFDVDVELDTVDVTPWNSSFRAELTLAEMNTVKLQVYHIDDIRRLMAKWNQFPPEPVQLTINGVGTANFLVHSVKVSGPFAGVLAYDVVFKLWPY